jgi:hypothetical protein
MNELLQAPDPESTAVMVTESPGGSEEGGMLHEMQVLLVFTW